MTFTDLFIIYLASGAPFGVYYFLSHRNERKDVLLKSILISLFWIPFAYRLLQKYVTRQLPNSLLSKKIILRNEEIIQTKKDLENVFIRNKFGIPLFELREILDRYVGLTEAISNQDESSAANTEFFEIAGNDKNRLAAKCYQRRNRKLLFFHQTLAGQDFSKIVYDFVSLFPNDAEIENFSLKLVRLLDDKTTEKNLRRIFNSKKQSRQETFVTKPEKDLWINDIQQPPTVKPLQISMNSGGATLNSPIKD